MQQITLYVYLHVTRVAVVGDNLDESFIVVDETEGRIIELDGR
jgi:hypothetical protein